MVLQFPKLASFDASNHPITNAIAELLTPYDANDNRTHPNVGVVETGYITDVAVGGDRLFEMIYGSIPAKVSS